MDKQNGCIFWLKMTKYHKNIILFGIRSVLLSKKKNVYNKELLKTQIKSHGDKITNFYNNKTAKGDSDHTCLAVLVY